MAEVLLVTCAWFPSGEPGAAALDDELRSRGIAARWVVWDDPGVEWRAADLVAVRSTWDYDSRRGDFLAWADAVGPRLLNGAALFRWNTDKDYLPRLAEAGLPVVPTVSVERYDALAEAVARHPVSVVKPRVGAGGRGVDVVRAGEQYRPGLPGPWIVQPLVDSVRTVGEISVFVFDGTATSQVVKRPAPGEIRVHEHLGGVSLPTALAPEAARLAESIVATAGSQVGRGLDYARVDLMRHDGRWLLSELEATEPGLYLDVMPENAVPFADLLARRLGEPSTEFA